MYVTLTNNPEKPIATPVVTSYSIIEKNHFYVVENHELHVLGGKKRGLHSRGTFSKKNFRLLSYQAELNLDFPKHNVEIVPKDGGFLFFHRVKKKAWTEFHFPINPIAIPYLPFAMGELALLLRKIDWMDLSPQSFPVLPVNITREFGVTHNEYVIRILPDFRETSLLEITRHFKSPTGVETLSTQIATDSLKRTIVGASNARYGVDLIRRELKSMGSTRYPRLQHAVRILKRKKIFSVDEPLALTLWSAGNLSKAKKVVWFFDLVRDHHLRSIGTTFQRDFVYKTMVSKGFGAICFNELLADSHLGNSKPIVFETLQGSILSLWKKLPMTLRNKIILMGSDENCFLTLKIFQTQTDRPPLILLNPLWGTDAEAQCALYANSILSVGTNGPSFQSNNLEHIQTAWEGRFFNRLGIKIAETDFEYTPQTWHPTMVDKIIRWIRKL